MQQQKHFHNNNKNTTKTKTTTQKATSKPATNPSSPMAIVKDMGRSMSPSLDDFVIVDPSGAVLEGGALRWGGDQVEEGGLGGVRRS